MAMKNQPTLALDRVLRVLQPLVRLLLRNGVTYTVFAAALKRVFLDAARQELAGRGMAQTDSALSLLSGVHRPGKRSANRPPVRAQPQRRPIGCRRRPGQAGPERCRTGAESAIARGSPR